MSLPLDYAGPDAPWYSKTVRRLAILSMFAPMLILIAFLFPWVVGWVILGHWPGQGSDEAVTGRLERWSGLFFTPGAILALISIPCVSWHLSLIAASWRKIVFYIICLFAPWVAFVLFLEANVLGFSTWLAD